jgi:hypothetical protein
VGEAVELLAVVGEQMRHLLVSVAGSVARPKRNDVRVATFANH